MMKNKAMKVHIVLYGLVTIKGNQLMYFKRSKYGKFAKVNRPIKSVYMKGIFALSLSNYNYTDVVQMFNNDLNIWKLPKCKGTKL
jgi:hypothetical protein